MKKFMKRLNLKDESGATVVIVALFMVVLLGFTALAIDGGRLYLEKSRLQKALDAAVLAGALELRSSPDQAKAIAIDTAQKNGSTIPNVQPIGNSIKASHQVPVEMTFAKVLGIKTAEVSATAKAVIGPIIESKGVTPIALTKNQIPNEKNLKCKDGDKHSPGNCGYLDFDTNGANGLKEAIINGKSISTNEFQTEPGEKWGPVLEAFQTLKNRDSEKGYCHSASSADLTCERVIIIPVIDTWDGTNGKDTVKVVAFAAYWIDYVPENTGPDKDKAVTGEFLKIFTRDEIGSGPINEYNLNGIKLVE